MLTEAEGCAVLKRAFVARGYAIAENVAFDEEGVRCHWDGWDAAARVGYEYLTREAGDEREFPPEALAALEARMERGELYVLLVDESAISTEADLVWAAEGFLAQVSRRKEQSP